MQKLLTIKEAKKTVTMGLPDLHPDPLVTSTDPDADPAPDPSLF